MSAKEGPALIDKVEAARQIGGSKPVSISFINQLLARKVLPRARLSYKVTRIPQDAVTEFIRSRTVNATKGRAPNQKARHGKPMATNAWPHEEEPQSNNQ